jgi:hypothetical protein
MGRIVKVEIEETVERALRSYARERDQSLDALLEDLLEIARQRRVVEVKERLAALKMPLIETSQMEEIISEARAERDARGPW